MYRTPRSSDFLGKTVKSINAEAANVLMLTFTDGTKIELWAETFSSLGIPKIYVDDPDLKAYSEDLDE